MRNITECIFCHQDAELITSERTIQKGLVKVTVPQHSYECTDCKRTFRTREQILEDGDLKTKKLSEIQTVIPNRGHQFTTPQANDATKKDNH